MLKATSKILLISIICIGFLSFANNQQDRKKYKIKVFHPGISNKDSIERELFEKKHKDQREIEFYMDIETVVCGDLQCKIDIIRILWNKFGEFKRIELLNGVNLEKANGEHFTTTDYLKLNEILQNEKSSLKKVYKNEIVSNSSGEGFDAVSGETILLEKGTYVKGAVWTCYTLWHWVHGNTKGIIRNITGDTLSSDQLLQLLKSNLKNEQIFALEELTRRKDYSYLALISVKEFLKNNSEFTKKTVKYFQQCNLKVTSPIILELYNEVSLRNRLLYLNILYSSNVQIKPKFYIELFNTIKTNQKFEEVNLYIEILEDKKITNVQINSNLIKLLENGNILISRRVYWFLKKQKLTGIQNQQLQNFYYANKHRL